MSPPGARSHGAFGSQRLQPARKPLHGRRRPGYGLHEAAPDDRGKTMRSSSERLRQRLLVVVTVTGATGGTNCTHDASVLTARQVVELQAPSATATWREASPSTTRLPSPSSSTRARPHTTIPGPMASSSAELQARQSDPHGASSAAPMNPVACYPVTATHGTCLSGGNPSLGSYTLIPLGFHILCSQPYPISDGQCCYVSAYPCAQDQPPPTGRPMLIAGSPRIASLTRQDWAREVL